MILAEPFVVRSVIILRLSLPLVLWGGLTDELTDCCRSGATQAGELVVMDFFLCHGNFMRPKKKAAAPTAPSSTARFISSNGRRAVKLCEVVFSQAGTQIL